MRKNFIFFFFFELQLKKIVLQHRKIPNFFSSLSLSLNLSLSPSFPVFISPSCKPSLSPPPLFHIAQTFLLLSPSIFAQKGEEGRGREEKEKVVLVQGGGGEEEGGEKKEKQKVSIFSYDNGPQIPSLLSSFSSLPPSLFSN